MVDKANIRNTDIGVQMLLIYIFLWKSLSLGVINIHKSYQWKMRKDKVIEGATGYCTRQYHQESIPFQTMANMRSTPG